MMSVILGLAWFIAGLVFMVMGKDFDTVFRCFLLCAIFFVGVNISSLRTTLKDNVRLVVKQNDLKEVTKEDKNNVD